jgi:hypothetical protein
VEVSVDPARPESASSTKKWLLGCGIGCGVIIVIVALLVTGGFLYLRNLVKGFEDSEAMLKTLTEKHGGVSEFCPAPDGTIGPDRLEVFLQVRESTVVIREKIEESINTLTEGKLRGEEEIETSGGALTKIRLAFGLIPQLAEFYRIRTQTLLDKEMGLGEYYYIYSVAYLSWLGKSISEGFNFQFRDGEEFRIDDWEDETAQQVREDVLRRYLNRMLLSMLQNQMEKLTSKETVEDIGWKEKLAAEIKALEADSHRFAWEEGLPEAIAASLEPFRSRLESSYSAFLTTIELSLEQR